MMATLKDIYTIVVNGYLKGGKKIRQAYDAPSPPCKKFPASSCITLLLATIAFMLVYIIIRPGPKMEIGEDDSMVQFVNISYLFMVILAAFLVFISLVGTYKGKPFYVIPFLVLLLGVVVTIVITLSLTGYHTVVPVLPFAGLALFVFSVLQVFVVVAVIIHFQRILYKKEKEQDEQIDSAVHNFPKTFLFSTKTNAKHYNINDPSFIKSFGINCEEPLPPRTFTRLPPESFDHDNKQGSSSVASPAHPVDKENSTNVPQHPTTSLGNSSQSFDQNQQHESSLAPPAADTTFAPPADTTFAPPPYVFGDPMNYVYYPQTGTEAAIFGALPAYTPVSLPPSYSDQYYTRDYSYTVTITPAQYAYYNTPEEFVPVAGGSGAGQGLPAEHEQGTAAVGESGEAAK